MGKKGVRTTKHISKRTPNRLSAEEVRNGEIGRVMILGHPRTIALASNVSNGLKLVADAIMVLEIGRHVDNFGKTQRFLGGQTGGNKMLIDMIEHTYPITYEKYLSRTQG
jgi:hypothetical protein